jgi:hypothetical protein
MAGALDRSRQNQTNIDDTQREPIFKINTFFPTRVRIIKINPVRGLSRYFSNTLPIKRKRKRKK